MIAGTAAPNEAIPRNGDRVVGKIGHVIERERIVAAALGSALLEGAEPGPEARQQLARWAASDADVAELEQLALDASRGVHQSAVPPLPTHQSGK